MQAWVFAAGLGQLALVLASLRIPRELDWAEKLQALDPLTRAVFWTYAGYILGTNLAFALVSILGSAWLVDGTPLARCVCGFIAAYWGVRIVVQLTVFHGTSPAGRRFRIAEAAMAVLFVGLTVVYTLAALA